MERTTKYSRLTTLAASVFAIAVLFLAKGILIPFALAMLVTFLLAPLVLRLQRWHFNRIVAVVSAMLLVLVVSSATGWLVVGQVREVTQNLSEYKQNIHERLATLRGMIVQPVQAATAMVTDLGSDLTLPVASSASVAPVQTVRIAEPLRGSFEVVREALGPAANILLTAALVFLFAFVMLLRRDDLGDRFIRMVGRGNILVTTRGLEEAAKKVSGYLWRLLLLNGLHGLAVAIGLAWIGIPNALLWGLVSAMLRFIPYVGPWIAASLPILTALAVSPGWSEPLLTLGLFATLELISNNLLEPWIYGKGTGISPLAILVSALFWTWLWGPVGLVLSTPLTVCLVVMGKHVPQLQFLNLIFGDAPGLSPPSRLYQRLIASDQDPAWLVLRTELERQSLHEVYDSVVLPALSMAEHDRQRGALDQEIEGRIEETMKLLIEEAGEFHAGSGHGNAFQPTPADALALHVLCIPARGAVDALAAAMLRQVLERDGMTVEVIASVELSGVNLGLLETRHVDVVCISAVPPSRFIHVRQLCKRIAARFPNLPIVAGMWTLELDSQEQGDRLPIPAGVQVVTSFAAARSKVCELAASRRAARMPAPQLASAAAS